MESEGFAIYDAMMRMKAEVLCLTFTICIQQFNVNHFEEIDANHLLKHLVYAKESSKDIFNFQNRIFTMYPFSLCLVL